MKKVICKLSFLSAILGFSYLSIHSAHAYNSIINNGTITESGTYKLGSELQVLTDTPTQESGGNILLFIDLPTKSPSLDYRFKFGTGDTDMNLGVAAKWIPIPDLQNQPALGAIFDFDWISDNDFDYLTFRFAPLISKNFGWEYGSMTPYAALPIGGRYYLDNNGGNDFDLFLQLAFGVELNFAAYDNLSFFGEAGFDLDKSITYFSLAARYKM
jgi:hypothetical protein